MPTLDSSFFRDVRKSNPEIAPYIQNMRDTFIALERAYKGSTLQTESLPEVNIGGK